MPRLTNREYLQRHREARRIWCQHQGRFADLSYREQQDIHDYYRPAMDLSDEELIERRKQVSRDDPFLPAQAGKAYKLLVNSSSRPRPASPAVKQFAGKRDVRVRAIARPEPNLKLLAQALVDLATSMTDEQLAAYRKNLND